MSIMMQWYRMFASYMDRLIIAVVALIIFGGTKKIPEMARNLGKASGEFKRGQMEIKTRSAVLAVSICDLSRNNT